MRTFISFRNLTRSMLLSAVLYLVLVTQLLAAPAYLLPTYVTDTIHRRSEGHSNYTYNNGSTVTQLSMDGKITFTDDEKDIKSITPGGYFRYSKTTFGNKREIFIRSNSEGVLKREYFVGGNETSYEPEGRQWLQESIKELLSTTALGAEDRVKRIYGKSGVNGVLAEIARMENDHVKSTYYGHLLALPHVKEPEMKALLAQLGKNVKSDFEKSRILQRVGVNYLQNSKLTDDYLAAVNSMSSDFEKSRVLSHLLDNSKLSAASFSLVLQAVADISSDFEQSKILQKVLTKPDLTAQAHKEAIGVLRSVNSDFEKAKVLLDLASKPEYLQQNLNEMLVSVEAIKSDFERSRVLNKIITAPKLTTKQQLQVLPVIANMNSDFEKSRVLQNIKTKLPMSNNEVRTEYIKTAKTIRSDFEYRRVTDGLL